MVKQEGVFSLAAAVPITKIRPPLLCNPIQYRLCELGQKMLHTALQLLSALITHTQSLQRGTVILMLLRDLLGSEICKVQDVKQKEMPGKQELG